jgi:putative heme iron utilization protein
MSVIDPHTGESFWDDSRRWGSLLVARATKDLIVEFKEELAVEEVAGKVTPSS